MPFGPWLLELIWSLIRSRLKFCPISQLWEGLYAPIIALVALGPAHFCAGAFAAPPKCTPPSLTFAFSPAPRRNVIISAPANSTGP